MQALRVYDPERRPSNWTDIIRAGQFVAFAKQFDSGAPCDAAGATFASPEDVTCLIFDSLPAAETFCRACVEDAPGVRFDLFDSGGRAHPPLLTIVHPSRTAALEGNPRTTRLNTWGAIALIIAAPILFWIDWARYDGLLILPTILGINFLLIAARLFQLNGAYASAEKSRRERLRRHAGGADA